MSKNLNEEDLTEWQSINFYIFLSFFDNQFANEVRLYLDILSAEPVMIAVEPKWH